MTAKEYNKGVRQWSNDVMRFAIRCCHDRAECEDAMQEAYASLWLHREEVQETKAKSYLMSAVYRQLITRLRHRIVEEKFASETIANEQLQPNESFDVKQAIEMSLNSLTPQQRAILQLRDVEGYAYREIAQTLEISEEKVQVYLFRARVAMRKKLTDLGYDNH